MTTPEPTVIPRGAGEVLGDSPARRAEVLSEHDALHATWSRFAAGREGADLHVHRRHTDLFYVLEGELSVRLGPEGEGMPARARALARVPPLVVHGFRNASDADVSYLNLHAPGQGFVSYMRALRDGHTFSYDQEPPPPDGGRSRADAAVGGEAFTVELPGRRLALLADSEEIAIAEARIEPGAPPQAPHRHGRHAESLYVLEGEVALTAGGREQRLEAGTWAQVPAGVPHGMRLPGSQPARLLHMHTPSRGFGAFVRALQEGVEEDASAERVAFDQQPAGLHEQP